jgi:hypothetical protein
MNLDTTLLQLVDIPVGSLWRHTNGNIYRVLFISNMTSAKEEYPPTVNYINIGNQTVWSRPVSKWYKSMTLLTTLNSIGDQDERS